jgi:hypothetical protein
MLGMVILIMIVIEMKIKCMIKRGIKIVIKFFYSFNFWHIFSNENDKETKAKEILVSLQTW